MILVALVVVVLGTYAPLMHAASGGNAVARALGALEGLAFVAGTAVASLLAAYLSVAKCDESCTEEGSPTEQAGEWWHTLDAWQWKAQLVLALIALAAAFATLVLPLIRKQGAAVGAAVIGLAAFCAWALLIAPLGDQFGI